MQDLEFRLKPSKRYLIFIAGILLASVMIVVNLPFDARVKFIILFFVSLYSGWMFWQFGLLRSRYAITSIRRRSDGQWLIHTNAQNYPAELQGDSTITRLVSILRFRIHHRWLSKSCIIFRDSLASDDYRKLLVTLKME